jgi:ABC-2 type transport system ATP-binding protein
LIRADDGEIRVAGHDLARDPGGARAAIGVTGQHSAVDKLRTGDGFRPTAGPV